MIEVKETRQYQAWHSAKAQFILVMERREARINKRVRNGHTKHLERELKSDKRFKAKVERYIEVLENTVRELEVKLEKAKSLVKGQQGF
jgi:hypothetical protein